MWPRVVEVSLALWLALSPFIFRVPATETDVWAVDIAFAGAVMLCSFASWWRPLRLAHLGTFLVGLGVAVYGYVQERPLPDWHQNHVAVGLLVALFAILPTEASQPPPAWRRSW